MARVTQQRELRNRQNLATHVEDRTVHLARVILKDAQAGRLLHAIAHVVQRVALLDAAQHHESLADLSDDLAVHPDAGFKHPLYHQSHAYLSLQ